MSKETNHIGVDAAVHVGGRESCASCTAMVDDGFYPPANDDVKAQPGWVSLIGGHRQWVPDINKLDIVLAEKASEPKPEEKVDPQSDTGYCATCGHAYHHHVPGSAQPKTGVCAEYQPTPISEWGKVDTQEDWVNPVHYRRGPKIEVTVGLTSIERTVECIEVCRGISDFRLANAVKYLWRVGFGGKMGEDEKQDVRKAIWYLNDFLEN